MESVLQQLVYAPVDWLFRPSDAGQYFVVMIASFVVGVLTEFAATHSYIFWVRRRYISRLVDIEVGKEFIVKRRRVGTREIILQSLIQRGGVTTYLLAVFDDGGGKTHSAVFATLHAAIEVYENDAIALI